MINFWNHFTQVFQVNFQMMYDVTIVMIFNNMFLGSMLPQYMALCVRLLRLVSFRLLRFVKKNVCLIRPSSYCLIHFGVSSGAARRRKKTFSTVRIRMGKLAWVSALQFWAQHNYDKTRNNGMSVNFAIWYFKQYTDGALWAGMSVGIALGPAQLW